MIPDWWTQGHVMCSIIAVTYDAHVHRYYNVYWSTYGLLSNRNSAKKLFALLSFSGRFFHQVCEQKLQLSSALLLR